MQALYAPSPGADVLFGAYDAHGLLRDPRLDASERARVVLRLADLERRGGAPRRALDRLADVDASVHFGLVHAGAIRCAALAELGEHEAAEALLTTIPAEGGLRDLARARLALLTRADAATGLPAVDAALAATRASGDPLCSEVAFEAHVLGVWLALASGATDLAGEHADAAIALLDPEKQPLTHAWVTFLRPHLDAYAPVRDRLTKEVGATFLDQYTLPVAHHRHRIGTIPLEVHGARMMHAEDADHFQRALVVMVAIHRQGGRADQAWAVARYGREIGARLFGPDAVALLDALLDELRVVLGDQVAEEAEARLMRVASFSTPVG